MKTVAVNTRLLLPGKLEGIGVFTREILFRMMVAHPETRFLLLFDRQWDPGLKFPPNAIPYKLGPQARHPLLFFIWFDWSVRRFLKKHKADVFFSPDGYLSLYSEIPQVPVIHDLNFEKYPLFLPRHIAWYYKTFFPKFARKAASVITVSEFSKNDISNTYGIDPKKIYVAGNAVMESFKPLKEEEKAKVRAKYSGGQPYFLYVGSLNPRKNIPNLIRAFDRFRKSNSAPFKLLLAGSAMWNDKDIRAVLKEIAYGADVTFCGRILENELPSLMAATECFVYVSLFEGFGIPVLEAFQSGAPVICSYETSLPEVAAEAALYADAFSPDSIAEQMLRIINDEPLRKRLIEAGFRRAGDFSWDKSAGKVWEVLELVMKDDPSVMRK